MFFIKFKRLLPVDKLTISVIFICLISVLGCGVVERLFEPTSQISSSVFSEFQHRNCAIIDGAGQQQKIACSDLAPMAFTSDSRQAGVWSKAGGFRSRRR